MQHDTHIDTHPDTLPSPTRSRRALPVAGLVALGLLPALGACGDDDADAAPETIAVTAVDYAFGGLPESAPVGSELTFTNESESEAHEVVAIRLPDDERRPVEELVQLPPDQLGAFFPHVETVLVAGPGEDGVAVEGTGVLSRPGRYALICVIPTGADPAEYLAAAAAAEGGPPDVAGGPPHIVNGMFAEIDIVE